MEQRFNVLIFNLKNMPSAFNFVIQELKTHPENTFQNISMIKEAAHYIKMQETTIVLFQVTNKIDLTKLVDLLKVIKPLLKLKCVKVVGFNSLSNPKVEKILLKQGVSEILESDILRKTIRYKFEMWNKSLHARNINEPEKVDPNKNIIEFIDPITSDEDIWILKSKSDCKIILNSFLVKLLGPGPSAGKWNKADTNSVNKETVWRFDKRRGAPFELFPDAGAWFFEGCKPEFDWKTHRWSFPGSSICLFYFNGTDHHSRFKVIGKKLEIPKNSKFALIKEDLILKTINAEAELLEEKKSIAKGDIFSHLEEDEEQDKTKTLDYRKALEKKKKDLAELYDAKDNKIDTNLKGEITEQEGDIGGMLEGKITEQEGDIGGMLEGEINEQEGDIADPLKGETTYREEDKGGPLKGDITYREKDKGKPLKGMSYFQEEDFEKTDEKGDLYQEQELTEKELDNLLEFGSLEISTQEGQLEIIIKDDTGITNSLGYEFSDFFDNSLILEKAGQDFYMYENMKIQIEMEYSLEDENANIAFAAAIINTEYDDETGITMIEIDTQKVEPKALETFLDIYKQRQENILKFIKLAQGKG